MNSNPGIQNPAVIAWDGTTSYPRDIRKFVHFGWTFEATADITTDAVFNIQSAPPSVADHCVPGAFVPVPEVSICSIPATPGPQATVTIPAGTKKGTVCAGTIPCRPNAFVQLVAASGDTAKIHAVQNLQGPMI